MKQNQDKIIDPDKMVCPVLMYDLQPCGRKGEDMIEQKCLFHCARMQEGEQNQKRFKEQLEAYIKNVETNSNLRYYDFTKFHFSVIPFVNKTFHKPVRFRGAHFYEVADFQGAKFLDWADFCETIFWKRAFFSESNFQKSTGFSDIHFEDEALFNYCKFIDRCSFSGSVFKGLVELIFASFEDHADFSGANFQKQAFFTNADFKQEGSFSQAQFENLANFNQTKFGKKPDFTKTIFGNTVDFSFSTFVDGIEFTSDIKGRFFEKCCFQRLLLPKDAVVTFEKVNLNYASFLDTDLEKIIFRDVEWHRPHSMWRKKALWDEFSPLEPGKGEVRDYEKIAENYRQLVLNYERKRDYETAEDFHIGEMEVRRKKKGSNIKNSPLRKLRQAVNEYGLYKFLSIYGTSYLRALGVLVLILFVFSGIFLYAGFESSETRISSENQVIDYDLLPDSEPRQEVSLGQWWSDYFKALSLAFSIITFQRERFYQPEEEFFSRFWLYMSVIVLTGQAAMVLLAIRRRFKR